MKKRKALSLFLAVIMLMSSAVIITNAWDTEIYNASCDEIRTGEALVDEAYVPDRPKVNSPIEFFSNPNSEWHYYDYLTPAQKIVYNAIVSEKAGLNTATDASSSEAKITISFPGRECLGDSSSLFYDVPDNAVVGAISAAIDDYPEYFWLGSYKYSFSYSYDGTGAYWVTTLNLTFVLDTADYADWSVVRSCYAQLMNAVNNFTVSEGSRYAKCKYIHDRICDMTVYNDAAMAHQPTGVFISGKAVCEGYAEAFKLLCDRENIPCILVVGLGNGGAHKWNYVKMDDNKWYGVDVTWDDQDSNTFYDYFLVGSESINAVFGGNKFGNGTDSAGDHVNTGTHFSYDGFALTYPSIASQSYTGVIPFWTADASYNNQKGLMFIKKDAVLKEQIICTFTSWAGNAPSTNKASVSGTTTGATVTITSPVSQIYKVVRWADVNADNSVNTVDYSIIKSYIANDPDARALLDNNTEKFNAADINQDGVIDGFDMFYVNRYVNTNKFLND